MTESEPRFEATGNDRPVRPASASTFGDEVAFRAFYDRALPRVFGYLLHRVGDRDAAEDLTQQTFFDAVAARASFDGRSDPVTWIIGIARHRLADHFRARDRAERRRLRLVVREIEVDREAESWRSSDTRAAVVAALRPLPALQRAVLVLRYADGLPVREIAILIRRSEAATESLLARGRVAFRRSYADDEDER